MTPEQYRLMALLLLNLPIQKDNDIITDTPDSPEEGQMDSPKTGDSSNILFLLLPLAILSVAIAAILFINKQAHKN